MIKNRFALVAIFSALFIVFSIVFKNLYPDFLWFKSFGYQDVWFFQIKYQVLTFLIGSLIASFWFFINAKIATKVSNEISEETEIVFNTPFPFLNRALEQIRQALAQNKSQSNITGKVFTLLTVAISLGLGILFGLTAKSWWLDIFNYLYQVPYGMEDPIFNNDISFYLFSLPFFKNLHSWLFSLLFISFLFVGWIYLSKNILLVIFSKEKKYGAIKTHIISLVSVLFLLMSFGAWIEISELVYSSRGVVYGAGFTDMSVILPIKKIVAILYLVQAVLTLFLIVKMSIKLPYLTLVLIVLVNIVGLKLAPNIVQNYIVSPNELVKEEPYIKNSIALTREAYQLNNVFASDFAATNNLNRQDLEDNKITVENIRLWNQEPLKLTFRQLQEIRLYYEFLNVDVDRYMIDGQMQQVMLSPRELDSSQLTDQAQTWVNKHLVYTHGYGLCMTPVNKITEDGLPYFYVKDLPPSTTIDLPINRPEIYFGEKTSEFIVVNTDQKEFDYPKGDTNEYTKYAGSGGIKIGSILNKLIFAFKFNDLAFLTSSYIKNDSKLLFDHNIRKIVSKLTDFIVYDSDPYLVVTQKGRLIWMLDGYTISSHFPYSEKIQGRVNYIRNSVKVTIDAYDGTTTFYIADDTDPIIKTLDKIYPNLFVSLDEMPTDERNHIRYPKDLFRVQAQKYATYHMTDPQVFYNREDLWQIPNETYDTETQEMKPYYLVTKLPGDEKESFVLMLPFSPTNKDNMIGWMAVKCNPDEYGEFVVYKLPKDRTVYGPMQIESRIDQDTEISKDLTLWGQIGSRVIRGNLMIIPIEDSLLYVEPIYLQAEQSELPELKRVIMSYGDEVVMDQNLPSVINTVFGDKKVSKDIVLKEEEAKENVDIMQYLFETYDKLKDSAKTLEWEAFGIQLDKIDSILEKLKTESVQ